MEHTLDATNQKVGRVASKAAALLQGKERVSFARNTKPIDKVTIVNASKVSITDKKLKEEQHVRYSGYPGGLTHESLEKTVAKKGYSEVLKLAVSGMLPKNKLRTKMLLNLKITE